MPSDTTTQVKKHAVKAMIAACATVESPKQQIAHAIDIFNKEVDIVQRSGISNVAKFLLETYKHFEETGMVDNYTPKRTPLSVRRKAKDCEMSEAADDPGRRGTKRKRDTSQDKEQASPACTTLSIAAPSAPFPHSTSPLTFTSLQPTRPTRKTRRSTRRRGIAAPSRSVPLVRQDSSADPCTQQLSKRVCVR